VLRRPARKKTLKRLLERQRGRIARFAVLRKRLLEDRRQGFRDLSVDLVDGQGNVMDDPVYHRGDTVTREGPLSREKLIKNHAHGKHVGTAIQDLPFNLLR